MKNENKKTRLFFQDLAIVLLSVVVSLLLIQTHAIPLLLQKVAGLKLLGIFVAGLFFTSGLTLAPAGVTLVQLSHNTPLWLVAFLGALGAMIGDALVFQAVRGEMNEHINVLMRHKKKRSRLQKIFQMRSMRWLSFIVAGCIIISPLPDEVAFGILGLEKARSTTFLAIYFIFNFIGIALLVHYALPH